MKRIKLILTILSIVPLLSCEFSMSDVLDDLTITPGVNVIYDANGGLSGKAPIDDNYYPEGSAATVLDSVGDLTNSGMVFAGWNTADDGSGDTYTPGQRIEIADIDNTLYALWKTDSGTFYHVTYLSTGTTSGEAPTDHTYYSPGSTVYTQNEGMLKVEGSSFKWWEDSAYNNYAEGDSFTITASTSLTSRWTNGATYTVTYNGNGATSGLAPVDGKKYSQYETVILPNAGTLKKTGYVLAGWKIGVSGTTVYSVGGSYPMDTANVEFYAVWQKGIYHLAFNNNGGTGTMADITIEYLNTALLSPNSFTRTSRVFTGWATSSTGNAVYADGANYQMTTEGATLYAAWQCYGSLDKTFTGDGIVYNNLGGVSPQAYAVAVQSDGKIVTAGTTNGTNTDFIVARYNTDGSLDKSFVYKQGYAITDINRGSNDQAYAVAIQPDGKIVVAGTTFNSTSGHFNIAVVRYSSDGTLDASSGCLGKICKYIGFSGTGIAITDINIASDDIAYSVAIDADSKIVVAGKSGTDFAVVRYTTIGDEDPTFNTTGIVITSISSMTEDTAYSVALDGTDIVAAGRADGPNTDDSLFAVTRYNNDGTPDTAFNSDGIATYAIDSSKNNTAYSLAIDSSHRIVVTGIVSETWVTYTTINGQTYPVYHTLSGFGILRLSSAGTLDNSFGTSGVDYTELGTSPFPLTIPCSAVIQSDGKIIVAGSVPSGSVAVARYTTAGLLDSTFDGDSGSSNGLVTTTINGCSSYGASAALFDGKIIVAGFYSDGSNDYLSVLRYWQ